MRIIFPIFLSSTVNCGWENTCSHLNSGVPPPLFHDYKNISLKHLCDYTHHFKRQERNHSTNKCRQIQRSLQKSNLPGNNNSGYKYEFKEKIT